MTRQPKAQAKYYSPMVQRVFMITILAGVIVTFILYELQQKENEAENKRDCETELQRSFSGTVQDAWYDGSINVKAFVIYFTNGYKYVNPIFLKSLNGEVKQGDSIRKEAGAFRFEIFKPGITTPVIHVDTVDCSK